MADENTENMTPEQIAKLQKENCIFCKIIAGEIPSKKVYEDENFVGILDINPASDGHVLLLPKQHFQILPQIPPDIVGNLGIACSKISGKIIKAFTCDGTSIFIANGAVAGQRAPHFMVHIIPRKDNDNISLNPRLADIDERLFNTVKNRLLASMNGGKGPHPAAEEQANNETNKEVSEVTEEKEEKDSENKKSHKVYNANLSDSLEEEEDAEHDEDLNINLSSSEINDSQDNKNEPDDLDEDSAEETELEQEHRLKKERDSKREKENKKKQEKTKEKIPRAAKANASSKNQTSSTSSRSKVDFDKLSRLLGK